jgi:hypothetical protein
MYDNTIKAVAYTELSLRRGADIQAKIDSLGTSIHGYVQNNTMYALRIQNILLMHQRIYEIIATNRMLMLATLVLQYKLDHNIFPTNLDTIDNDIRIDPYTNQIWIYKVENSNVMIGSSGFDRELGTSDDIQIILK